MNLRYRKTIIAGNWKMHLSADEANYLDGFFDYMNRRGSTYIVTSAAQYYVIPHWEIAGR